MIEGVDLPTGESGLVVGVQILVVSAGSGVSHAGKENDGDLHV